MKKTVAVNNNSYEVEISIRRGKWYIEVNGVLKIAWEWIGRYYFRDGTTEDEKEAIRIATADMNNEEKEARPSNMATDRQIEYAMKLVENCALPQYQDCNFSKMTKAEISLAIDELKDFQL